MLRRTNKETSLAGWAQLHESAWPCCYNWGLLFYYFFFPKIVCFLTKISISLELARLGCLSSPWRRWVESSSRFLHAPSIQGPSPPQAGCPLVLRAWPQLLRHRLATGSDSSTTDGYFTLRRQRQRCIYRGRGQEGWALTAEWDAGCGTGQLCKDEGWWVPAKRYGWTGRSQDRQQSLLCPNQAHASCCLYLQKAWYRLAGQEAEMPYNVLRKRSSANDIQTLCFTSCPRPPDLQHSASFPNPARQNSTQPSPGKPD